MNRRKAAPKGDLAATSGHDDINDGGRASIPRTWGDLPAVIRQRLEREGVVGPAGWRALGRRRHDLFGIVPSVVRQLDALSGVCP